MRIEEFAARVRKSQAPWFFLPVPASAPNPACRTFAAPAASGLNTSRCCSKTFIASEAARVQHWQLKKATYELFQTVKPNIGHQAICEFEQRGQLLGLITQNIDGLHKIAGTSEAEVGRTARHRSFGDLPQVRQSFSTCGGLRKLARRTADADLRRLRRLS